MSKKTGSEPLLVEVLTASGCGRCQKAKDLARTVIAEFSEANIQYNEVNVVEDIDYAVALGVISTPAIAINGELVFPALPSAAKLRYAIHQRMEQR